MIQKIIFSILFFSLPLFAQSADSKLIILSEFSPHNSERQEKYSDRIYKKLSSSLQSQNFQIRKAEGNGLLARLNNANVLGAAFLVEGFYNLDAFGSLNIYVQIYHPQKKEMIDAFHLTSNPPELEGIKLDPAEVVKKPEVTIEELTKKLSNRIRSNPKRYERNDNINESAIITGLVKEYSLPLPKEDTAKDSEDVFKLLAEQTQKITTASNVVTDKNKQPASVTVINSEEIKTSGARTVNELLTIYVPGYFMVEDQDDTIAGFRGFAPDNNAKVLLLINGHNMNTEWFWGPPDSILNGLNLDYIERIEVIRGPGSVTLGQGALLGVINIITKTGNTNPGTTISGSYGKDSYNRLSIQAGASGKEITDLKTFFQVSTSRYQGQKLRSEGWAKAKEYEGVESEYSLRDGRNIFIPIEDVKDNDLVLNTEGNTALVARKNIASGYNRLRRANQDTVLGNIQYKDLDFTGFMTNQSRDIYNFYRDRSILESNLKTGNLSYSHDFNDKVSLKAKGYYTQDDIILKSPKGLTMGGTRENRYGGSLIANFKDFPKNNNFAVGVEFRKYDMGQRDKNGNNFIINNADESLLNNVNQNNRYVYPDTIAVQSLFFEDFYKLSEKWDIFGAFRYDKHPYWGTNISPRLGSIYSFSSKLRFRLSYQEGFRGVVGVSYAGGFQGDGHLRVQNFRNIESAAIPNSFDSNGRANGYYASVPETKPEKMRSYELSANYNLSSSINIDTIFFYNNLRNIIDVGVLYCDKPKEDGSGGCNMPNLGSDVPGDWNGYWFYKNAAGEIRQGGAEIGIRYQSRKLILGFSHSLVRVITASSSQFESIYLTSDVNNLRFKGYPENVTRLQANYKPIDKWTLAFNYLFYPSWYSPRGNRVEGNHLINLSSFYSFLENLEGGMILKNALNHKNLYPMISNAGGQDLSDGSPSIEGRTYWLTLNYRF
jgi:outer membrane receptor protein involved in Fe transport